MNASESVHSEMLRFGIASWYAVGKTAWSVGLAEVTRILAKRMSTPEMQSRLGGDADSLNLLIVDNLVAGKWVDGAAVTISSSAEYFAAMACTSGKHLEPGDIHMPWPVVMFLVPPGVLVDQDGTEYSAAFLSCLTFEDPVSRRSLNMSRLTLYSTLVPSKSDEYFSEKGSSLRLEEVGEDSFFKLLFSDRTYRDASPHSRRMISSAKRAVVGLLYTMQHTNNFRIQSSLGKVRKTPARNGPPPHRNIFVGRPLSYDCTPALHAYHMNPKHKASPPSVQTLVRGHHKRQVIGIGRNGRKVIWVEPYWRGPEDAPILSRPHLVQ